MPKSVAIKAIKGSNDEEHAQLRRRELEILFYVQKGQHENIVKFYGTCEGSNPFVEFILLAMEVCHGTLRDLIERDLDFEDLQEIARQILNGLSYLHNLHALVNNAHGLVIHR